MLLVQNFSTDPAFNLALEEYLLTSFEEEILCLWRNRRAIIVGRNQNTLEEIDPDYVREHGIAVVRRITGGGAVFHDLGNLNYTLIQPCAQGDFANYQKFTAPIVGYLASLGVAAELSGRNDLLIDGMKFSGNAQTVRGGRIMHHGCLLFSASMEDLSGALRPRPVKFQSKGVKSVRSRVTNISSHLTVPMTVEEFRDGLEAYLLRTLPHLHPYRLTPQDLAAVNQLADSRYRTWEWNFAASPRCTLGKSRKFPFGIVDVTLEVREGTVAAVSIHGDYFGVRDTAFLEQALIGVRHCRQDLEKAAEAAGLDDYISGMTPEQLAELML